MQTYRLSYKWISRTIISIYQRSLSLTASTSEWTSRGTVALPGPAFVRAARNLFKYHVLKLIHKRYERGGNQM